MKSLKIMGRKRGMSRLFDEKGNLVPCSVIEIEPNIVVQLKTKERDGYEAIQLGSGRLSSARKKNVTKPELGHFKKAGVEPEEFLQESFDSSLEEVQIGQEFNASYFEDVEFVDVVGTTKGKGYQGVMKRHGFGGGPAAHGSGFHRHAGSTGMRSTPGRTFKEHKMPGHMGAVRQTTESLKVLKVDAEKGLLIVKGAIPGAKGCLVSVRKSMKKGK
ncbi:MAG: 50S ribosomal protein L3 [Simkaniaceae bacterium]|nr:50S ribosomal protein L3 [Simkaniaceae bacterium]